MLMRFFPALAALLLGFIVVQTGWSQTAPGTWNRATWTVLHDGDSLDHAWTGGLTAPQWSPFDADLDGDDDLMAFDRDGSRVVVFERLANGDLTVNWEWAMGFPALVDWCLLRDFNCDGKADIFTSHMNGIRVFENTTVVGEAPSFSAAPLDLTASFDFGSGASELPVICIGMDLPAIMDHDDDGDLDIITFTETATTLYRFQGQSPCGLELVCTNRCYGMLEEAAENNALFIGDDFECSFNVANPGIVAPEVNRTGLHAGGALTSLQLEAGGPKDLLVSDVTYPSTIGVVMESSSAGLDSAVFLDTEFPANLWGDQAVNLPRFPAAFHLDVDLDGTKDLLFSPNTPLETNDDAGVHWFKNTGSEDAPLWAFQDSAYLQRDMIDMGRGAYPVLTDFDGDGLLDLAVANKERHEGIDQTPAFVASYRNVGSANQPRFDKVNDDWIPLSTFQIESAYPAFGDLDGDGDLDVIVGDELGLLHRFDNVAEAGEWPSYVLAALSIPDVNTGNAIDVGQFATPQLLDMDGDGDLDLVVGEKNGTLTLVEQDALGAWSVYTSPIHGENWGGLLVDNLLGINGYCVPALTQTEEGLRVFVANEVGRVQDFGVFTGDWDADLVEVNDNVFNLQPGFRAAAAFADLNQDGLLDGLIGIQNGGLLAFEGSEGSTETLAETAVHDAFNPLVMPNPGQEAIQWSAGRVATGELQVWSIHGQRVHRQSVAGMASGGLDTRGWEAGAYILVWTNDKGAPEGAPLTWIKLPD